MNPLPRALAPISLGMACACSPAAAAGPTPEPPAHAHTLPEKPRSSQERDAFDPNTVVAQALSGVAALRKLPAKGPVKGKTISRPEMVDYVRGKLRKEIPEPVLRAQTELLFALGTVPDDFDYEKSLLELMGNELAGFYDPETKTMYLGRDLSAAEL